MFKGVLSTVLAAIALLIIVPIFLMDNAPITLQEEGVLTISINGKKLVAEVADEPHEQTRGLSGRNKLGIDEGMLFVFPQPIMASFWMKDMHFPIDIIWIDQNLNIIDITQDIYPYTYPETFSPPLPIMYVLEVNAGWTYNNKINIGNKLEL